MPPLGLVPSRARWHKPFLYCEADITAMLSEAARIDPPLRAATYHTLLGLLAATGLRVGEAINLDRGDIDWVEGVLLIRETKFGKSRRVPLQPSTLDALHGYDAARRAAMPRPKDPALFVSRTGRRLIYAVVRDVPTHRHHRRSRRRRAPPTAASRPKTYLCHSNPAPLVPGRRERPGEDPGPVHLPRAP